MTTQDLQCKRDAFMQKLQIYKEAIRQGDQSWANGKLNEAIRAGKDYVDRVGEFSKEGEVSEQDLIQSNNDDVVTKNKGQG